MSYRRKITKNSSMIFYALFVVCTFLFILSSAYADDLSAKAAIVIDGKTGKILYAKNPHLRVPPASTTKLMTAMVVLDRLSLDSVVVVSENAAETPSVTPHINKGERFTVRDLLYLALMRSVNSAAVALAEATAGFEHRFVDLMNEKAMRMGLENTRFINSSGLPGPDQYITAYDLSIIMKESLKYPTIREILNTKEKEIFSLDERRLHVKNTNNLLWRNDDILGGKTGYTRAAGHCLVCAEDKDNNLLISVVLGETVRENLWGNTSMLLAKGYEVLNQKGEPVVYLSRVAEGPVIPVSYIPKKNNPRIKKEVLLKNKKYKYSAKVKNKRTNIVAKKSGKKTKNLSANRQKYPKKELKS
jgi:D-alanyl-D-alanine carboxypeptidase